MSDLFNRIERHHGYKLLRWFETLTYVKNIIGPDAVGQYWALQGDSAGAASARRLDRKGEVLSTHTLGGSSNPVGAAAVDKYGFPWFGSTGQTEIIKLDFDGSTLAVVTLTDGADDYRPTGAIAYGDYIYVVGLHESTATVRLFRVSLAPGAEAIEAFGTALASAGAVVGRMDLVDTGLGTFWCTDPNRAGDLISFGINSLAPTALTLTWSVGAATAGLMGIHRAFGYFWVGGDTLDSVGSTPPQIIRVDSAGDVGAVLQFADGLRVSDFDDDGEYLYAAVTGKSGASNVGDNRIEKLTTALAVEDTFNFDGGQGEEIRTLAVVSDDVLSPFPESSLVDASVWLRADDPEIPLFVADVVSVPNRGPQRPERALLPKGAAQRPLLAAGPALRFDGSDDNLAFLTPPDYSLLSTYFNGTDEYVTFGDVYGFEYTDSFSFSAWIKWSTADYAWVLFKQLGSTSYQGYSLLGLTDGKIQFALVNNQATTNKIEVRTATAGFNDGAWHHVVATWSGNASPVAADVTIYVDGSPETPDTPVDSLSGTIVTAAAFSLGQRAAALSSGGELRLDEVAVYDKELSAGEVTDIFGLGVPSSLGSLSSAPNLVGWWRMGEGDANPTIYGQIDGTTTVPLIPDASENGHDGTMTNMVASNIQRPVPQNAFSKYSLKFDGVNEYLTFGDVLGFERTDPFSVSFWFKATGGQGTFLSKMDVAPQYSGYSVTVLSGGEMNFQLYGDVGSTDYMSVWTTSTWLDGEWHYVVWTYDGSVTVGGCTCYVDGVPQSFAGSSNTLTVSTLSSAPFQIGQRSAGDWRYEGYLSDVAVYDAELLQADVTWIYNSGTPNDLRLPAAPSDLLAYYRLGDGAECCQSDWVHKIQQWRWNALATKESTTITDAGPFNSPGTLYNMDASNVTTDTPGGISDYSCTFSQEAQFSTKSVLFDGVSNYITLGNVFDFERTDSFSVSIWYKPSTTSSATRVLVGKMQNASGQAKGWWIAIEATGGLSLSLWSGLGSGNRLTVVTNVVSFDTDSWRHWVVTYDGSSTAAGVKHYVQGVHEVNGWTAETLTSSIVNTAAVRIADTEMNAGLFTFDGNIDDPAIYNKELSPAEVAQIFNGGQPEDLGVAGMPSGLVGWWLMGDGDTFPTITDNSTNSNDGTMSGGLIAGDIVSDTPGGPQGLYCNVGSSQSGLYAFENSGTATFSGWVKTTATDGYLWGAAKWNAGLSGTYMYLDGGRPAFSQGRLATNVSITGRCNNTINDGAWHHVVGTAYNAGGWQIKIWVDGVAQPVTIIANNLGASSIDKGPFSIGACDSAQYSPLAAQIDEVAVWRMPFAQAHVDELYATGAPLDLRDLSTVGMLMGWWRMGDAYSLSGLSVNMEAEDKQAIVPGPENYTVRSMWFDGSNDYVSIGDASAFDFEYTDAFSVSAWVHPYGVNGNRGIFWKHPIPGWSIDCYGGTGYGNDRPINDLRVYMRGTTGVFEVYLGSKRDSTPYGTYFHFVMTYDGSNSAAGIKMYVDGVEWPVFIDGNIAMTGTMKNSSVPRIGRDYAPDSTAYWKGWQDETSVWNKVLSQADVTELFNGGDPVDLLAHTSVADLVGWWRMGEGTTNGTMVNMDDDNFNDDTPVLGAALPFLHDGSSYTLAAAFKSTGAGDQTIFTTLPSTINNAATGAALIYNGTTETVRLVIANGSGVDYVLDTTTAVASVPLGDLVIVTVRVDFGDTPEAEIRIWVGSDFAEYIEEWGTATAQTPSGASEGAFAVGGTGAGTLDGDFLEGSVLDRKITDNELRDLVEYLMRWM